MVWVDLSKIISNIQTQVIVSINVYYQHLFTPVHLEYEKRQKKKWLILYTKWIIDPAEQPGAMGKGQQTATALTTFFQFWCYITPVNI